MANLRGFNRDSAGAMVAHWTRHAHDPDQARHTYRNQSIDPSRTHLNYDLGAPDETSAEDVRRWVAEGVAACDRRPSARTNVVSCWVVTLPRDWPEGRDPRDFFEAAYGFLAGEVGRERHPVGFVHMDETTPHMHFAFVPICRSQRMVNDKTRPLTDARGRIRTDRKGTVLYERVPVTDPDGNPVMTTGLRQSAIFGRDRMRTIHRDLQDAVERGTGVRCSVLLGEGERERRALSDVPQERLDDARRAVGREAGARREAARRDAADIRRRALADAVKSQRDAAESQRMAAESQRLAAESNRDAAEARREAERWRDLAEAVSGETYRTADGREHVGLAGAQRRYEEIRSDARRAAAERDEAVGERDAARSDVESLRGEESRLEARVEELRVMVRRLEDRLGELAQRVWELVCDAWRDHGPWAEEQDGPEVSRAVGEAIGEDDGER